MNFKLQIFPPMAGSRPLGGTDCKLNKCILRAAVALFTILICSSAFSQEEWPMFRQGSDRTGVALTAAGDGVLGMFRPNAIWMYPVVEADWDPIDNSDAAPAFQSSGDWTTVSKLDPNAGMNVYGDDYLATLTDGAGSKWAKWSFDFSGAHVIRSNSRKANFHLYVWIPFQGDKEDPERTTDAHYTVKLNDAPAGSFIIDQRGGGAVSLGTYTVRDADILSVTLTNQTEVTDGLGNALSRTVVADDAFIKAEAGNGSQICSSPVACDNPDPFNLTYFDANVLVSCSNSVLALASSEDSGGGSRFIGWITGIGTEPNSGITRDNPQTGLPYADDRGIMKWVYPAEDRNWISGGISATPTILGDDGTNYTAVIAAGDAQVYWIDPASNYTANNNIAVPSWHGPGYYKYNPTSTRAGTKAWVLGTHAGFQQNPKNTAEDAYYHVQAIAPTASGSESNRAEAKWTVDVSPRVDRKYSVQVWIPPSQGFETYINDARYTVELDSIAVADPHKDQRNGGRWITLAELPMTTAGGTITVTLNNETNMDQTLQTYYVAADAMRVIPSDIGSFEFSSPLMDPDGSSVYLGSTGGRIYKLAVDDPEPVWTYPKPGDEPLGAVYASIAEKGGNLYVGSEDGHLYCLTTGGTLRWAYPSIPTDPNTIPETLAAISSTAAIGDYIYIATGGWGSNMPYNSEGRIIAIKDDPLLGPQVQWVYPATGDLPAGSFVYASPLFMSPTVFLGSTDGYFYGVDAVGAPIWPKIDMGYTLKSSAAGTLAQFWTMNTAPPGTPSNSQPRLTPIGMAFINAGNTIYALDLSAGKLEGWQWPMMSSTVYPPADFVSSPALYRERIYTGDPGGFVWAFSSRIDPSGAGVERWNPETGMTGPPVPSPEGTGGRQAAPKIDVFTQDNYGAFLVAAEASRTSKTLITFDLANPPEPRVPKGPTIIHEWGEDIYIIVWNILDPNQKDKDNLKKVGDAGFLAAIEGGHKVEITIKSRDSGRNADSQDVKPLAGKSINYYVDPGGSGFAIWYAAYTYVLDGSSSSNPQTPGSEINIGVKETPSGERPSDLIWVVNTASLNTPQDPQRFAINNPLAIVYTVPYGGKVQLPIGVDSALQTDKNRSDAQMNGNVDWPMVWGGITPHNKPSQTRSVTVIDRSLLGANRKGLLPARSISKFRLERQSLRWNGFVDYADPFNPESKVVNPIMLWETLPQDQRTNRPNMSPDYPNIGTRQISSTMASGGQDPSQAPQELLPTTAQTFPGPLEPWSTQSNNVSISINVPRFQPANMPKDPNALADPDLMSSGYIGGLYAYVDSNGNGIFDKPAGLGMAATQNKAEAYRALATQVHVPVDRRAELSPERINLGELPHGFGYTDVSGVPYLFLDNLIYNTYTSPAGVTMGLVTPAKRAGAGFAEWFQTFEASNVGNTNLLDVQVERTPLASDTVQYPFYDPSKPWSDPTKLLVGSGHFIPSTCVVSTTDGVSQIPARTGFVTLGTGVPPLPGAGPPDLGYPAGKPTRTLHKPRVGASPTELTLPDVPEREKQRLAGMINIPNPPNTYQLPLPAVGVAMPLGQPAGTYYGKIRLWDIFHTNSLQAAPVSNPIEIVVKATESRLTDGYSLNTAPHLPHLDPMNLDATGKPKGTGDAMPAAYRDRVTGNVHLYWTSSRYGPKTTNNATTATTTADPWYLYKSTLTTQDGAGGPGNWTEAGVPQWWAPTDPNIIFPDPVSDVLSKKYFPGPPLGASDEVLLGSVRFSSPAVAVDEASGTAWLLFGGQAYKYDPALPEGKQRTLESRVYYAPMNDGAIVPADVHSPSPNPSGDPIAGDWTTPKFGVRGMVLKPPSSNASQLWCFWYGGNADRWRIYYNANPTPSNPAKWTNEAPLPLAKGLSSAAEPSPVAWWHPWGRGGQTGDTFDIVYSAYSTFHKNSDIYLSRYQADAAPATAAKGGHWPVTLQLLPQRRVDKLVIDGCEKLARDVTRGVWSTRDVDWDTQIVSFTDKSGPPAVPPSFEVYVQLDPNDPTTIYKLNYGAWTRDTTSGAIAFNYDANASGLKPAEVIYVANLRQLFRAVVINPAEGTVKFLSPPAAKAIVFAKYRPKAYRLTEDPAADASPFAIGDYYNNLRYAIGNPPGNPFFVPSSWDAGTPPPYDRFWVLWRRPGAGICYKTIRYVVQLKHQLALKPVTFEPAISSVIADPAFGVTLTYPIEVDWTKNRLYFAIPDAVGYTTVPTGPTTTKQVPVPNQVFVSYTDSLGVARDNEAQVVQMIDEEMGSSGKTFGNLTNIAVNESQVSAFKDPWDNKVWVFWTSTRSGNPDLYYETISPLFYGKRFGEIPWEQ